MTSRASRLPRAARFAVVGGVNTLVDLAVFTVLVYVLGWPPPGANVVSYSCGLVNSFALNRRWTFGPDGRHPAWLQLVLFSLVSFGGLALGTVVVWALSPLTGALVAKLCAIGVTFGWNYTLSHAVVFRPSPPATGAQRR